MAANLDVDDGFVYLAGTPTVLYEDSDQAVPFRQRRYFFYLSGYRSCFPTVHSYRADKTHSSVDESDCHLIYDIKYDSLTLYIPLLPLRDIIWGGQGSTKQQALDRYDVDFVKYADDLAPFFAKLSDLPKEMLYVLHEEQCPPGVRPGSSWVNADALRPAMDMARVIKDEHEIKLMRRANDISNEAHRRVLANLLKFTNEAQVEGAFLDVSVVNDARPIVWHYCRVRSQCGHSSLRKEQ